MMDENNIQSDISECGTQECCKQDQQQLELQLNQCGQQVAEWKDKYLRLTADLDNVNRRAAKDRALSLQNAQVALLRPILSIVDDFERALESKQGDSASDTKGWDGISMIYTSLTTYLHSVGVEPMKSYDQFDPELHEALVQVDNSGKEAGAIVSVLQKGYLFKGEVLRHAKVSVAK